VDRVEYYINNNLLENRDGFPFSLSRNVSFLNNGSYELLIRACDNIDNCKNQTLNFTLDLNKNNNNQNTNISLISPSNGLALSGIDFPLNISLKIDNPLKISTIDAYIETREDNIKTKILTKSSPGTENLNISWEEKPASGTYHFWVTANKWSGDEISTEKILLTTS
jgi:hypothetical protein